MMNYIDSGNYILPDKQERELNKQLQNLADGSNAYAKVEQQLLDLQRANRGIDYTDSESEKPQIDPLVFAEYFLERCRMFCVRDTYYAYNKKIHCYEIIEERTIKKMIRVILDELDYQLYTLAVASTIFRAITEVVKETTELSPTEGVIIFQNGTLYTKLESKEEMEFRNKFSYKNIALHALPYDYNPDATCPKFMKFLDECMQGDQELIALLRDCCANIFAFGQVYVHHIVFFWGIGRNGKSVLCDVLDYLFPEMVSHIKLSQLTGRFGSSSMVGKVLNISPESEAEIKNTEVIKEISSGSTVEVERKFKDSFSNRITAKLFVSTNRFPYTEDTSKGWQDRLTIIPFERVFERLPDDGNKQEDVRYQNPHLLEELKEEREGITAWLLQGLQDLKERDWVLTHSIRANEIKQRVFLEPQPVLLFFISCVVKCPAAKKRIKTSEVHQCFKKWAERNSINLGKFYESGAFQKEFRRILELKQCDANPRTIHGYQYYVDIEMHEGYLSRVCYQE